MSKKYLYFRNRFDNRKTHRTNIFEASIIDENLLKNKSSNSFRQFRTSFHNIEAQWYNFSGEQKVDDVIFISFD